MAELERERKEGRSQFGKNWLENQGRMGGRRERAAKINFSSLTLPEAGAVNEAGGVVIGK